MLTPDLINAAFEALGGFVILLNIRRIRQDKIVRGMDWKVLAFFTSWGFWNLYYYPALDQMFSFYAGIGIVAANVVYLYLICYYIRYEKRAQESFEARGIRGPFELSDGQYAAHKDAAHRLLKHIRKQKL